MQKCKYNLVYYVCIYGTGVGGRVGTSREREEKQTETDRQTFITEIDSWFWRPRSPIVCKL